MTDIKTAPITIRELENQTELDVEDNGDGVLGPGDQVRSAEGESVSVERARQDYFLSRAQNHLSAWDGNLRRGEDLAPGIPAPSKSTILARAREMRALADGQAGAVPDSLASQALLNRANALGMAAEQYGSRTFGIPNGETRAQLTNSFKSVVEAARRDPQSEAAWVTYGMTVGNTFRSAPEFYHDNMEEDFGVNFRTELRAIEGNLSNRDTLPANLARAFVYVATREKNETFGESLDPGGTKLDALMGRLAEARAADPEGFEETMTTVMRGDAGEAVAKKLRRQLSKR